MRWAGLAFSKGSWFLPWPKMGQADSTSYIRSETVAAASVLVRSFILVLRSAVAVSVSGLAAVVLANNLG
jgi:hypothetical protein